MHYGQVISFDPAKHEGVLFCGDFRKPLRFSSQQDFEAGQMVIFDATTIAINVQANVKKSESVWDVPSEAAHKAVEDFASVDVKAYYGQHSNLGTVTEKTEELASPTRNVIGEDKSPRKLHAWED